MTDDQDLTNRSGELDQAIADAVREIAKLKSPLTTAPDGAPASRAFVTGAVVAVAKSLAPMFEKLEARIAALESREKTKRPDHGGR